MHADIVCGIVHIVLADNEHLTQVVGPTRLSQYLALKIPQCGISPASAATPLVFHACDRNLLYRRERFLHLRGNSPTL